jgi:hypothetical protein
VITSNLLIDDLFKNGAKGLMWVQSFEIIDNKFILPDISKNDSCCILKRFLGSSFFYNNIKKIKSVTKK